MNAWQEHIAQAVTEARALLSEQGYPETPGGGRAPFIIVMAYHILAYANEVNEAAVNGDMDTAMNIYHELLSSWEEMRAAREMPNGLPLQSVTNNPYQDAVKGRNFRHGQSERGKGGAKKRWKNRADLTAIINQLSKRVDEMGEPLPPGELWPALYAILDGEGLQPEDHNDTYHYNGGKISYSAFRRSIQRVRQ